MTIQGTNGAPAPAGAKRMTIGAVQRGVVQAPARVLLYGVEGIGKTTWAARAPAPIFLGTEVGFGLLDVARFPEPRNWGEVGEALRVLEHDAHEFRTLVVDSIDWLEPLCWAEVCRLGGKASIEDFGYGKGYAAALDLWRALLGGIERVWRAKRMHVVLLAHAQIKPYRNPEGSDYDRFTLKIRENAAGLFKEWCDAVLFANFAVVVDKKAGADKGKGIGAANRIVYTARRPAFDAKNRFGMPDTLPLEWAEFEAAALAPKDPAVLRVQLEDLAARVPAAVAEQARAYAAQHATDVPRLLAVINRLHSLVDSQEPAASTNPTE